MGRRPSASTAANPALSSRCLSHDFTAPQLGLHGAAGTGAWYWCWPQHRSLTHLCQSHDRGLLLDGRPAAATALSPSLRRPVAVHHPSIPPPPSVSRPCPRPRPRSGRQTGRRDRRCPASRSTDRRTGGPADRRAGGPAGSRTQKTRSGRRSRGVIGRVVAISEAILARLFVLAPAARYANESDVDGQYADGERGKTERASAAEGVLFDPLWLFPAISNPRSAISVKPLRDHQNRDVILHSIGEPWPPTIRLTVGLLISL